MSAPKLRVAFQGERGAFSEEAIRSLFNGAAEPLPCPTFEDLFATVESGRAEFGVAPLENSIAGPIERCHELLRASRLRVMRETALLVRHQLIGCPGSLLAKVRQAASHPVALAQCRRFFAQHPAIAAVASDDTAGSVRRVVQNADPAFAAVASEGAAQLYGGVVLATDIQDTADNRTRFGLLARADRTPITPGRNQR